MDAKLTLSFNGAVADKAKQYAEKNNISLSRLVEFLLDKVTSGGYTSFEEFPVSDWVNQVAEGGASYQTKSRSRHVLKKEFYSGKK
jgi:pectate lyase